MKKNAKFITVEGTEGAGKSTALQFIANYLTNAKIDFIVTREPGGTQIAEEIRKILLFPSSVETIEPQTELLLMFAGRSQHITQLIKPALESGKCVVSDRYVDASYAYQGGGRGIAHNQIKVLDELVVAGLYPQLTLLLDLPAEQGLARTERRGNSKDRIEQEKLHFFERVRNSYLERAKQDPRRIKIIDASQPLPLVEIEIYNVLSQLFGVSI